MLFGHGDDYYRTGDSLLSNYSSNVWYGADLTPLKEYLFQVFEQVMHYPEPDAGSLRRLLAEIHAVDPANLLVTNGSITAFYLIAQAWRCARSTILAPSFAEYEDACRLHQHLITFFPNKDSLEELVLGEQDLCWICNPNNPDGHLIAVEELRALFKKYPQTLFVIDQVYADFYPEPLLALKEVMDYPNLILVQSISKLHKIPGIRIGYVAAPQVIIQRLETYLIPWSVNVLAVEAGKYVLQHPEIFPLPLAQWLEEMKWLQEEICRLGIFVYPSVVPFFLNRLPEGYTASDLKQFLREEKGILIRDASNFQGLNERHFRLSTQQPAENQRLVEALREFLH